MLFLPKSTSKDAIVDGLGDDRHWHQKRECGLVLPWKPRKRKKRGRAPKFNLWPAIKTCIQFLVACLREVMQTFETKGIGGIPGGDQWRSGVSRREKRRTREEPAACYLSDLSYSL